MVFKLTIPFSSFTDCLTLMLKQSSLCFINTFSLLRHCKELLQNHFCFYCLFREIKICQNHSCKHNVIYNHQLKATNRLSLQIFSLKHKFEKPTHLHNHVNAYIAFYSILLKSFSCTGNSLSSSLISSGLLVCLTSFFYQFF